MQLIWTRGERAGYLFVHGPDLPACGGVWPELGAWRAEAWIRGRPPVGRSYASRQRAMHKLEKLLIAHPEIVRLEDPRRRGTKSSPTPLPDWRMAQYLREADARAKARKNSESIFRPSY